MRIVHLAAFGFLFVVLSGCAASAPVRTLETFGNTCYDRSMEPQTAIVDTHVHLRPFGGPAVPFNEAIGYFRRAGVLFVNIFGIGQMLPVHSPCTYYLDCPGTPVLPTLKNDFVNAANVMGERPEGIHVTLSMTFPDLMRPGTILPNMEILDREFPGVFRFMGELNMVKQAQFDNAHEAVPKEKIAEWAGFMKVLRERDIPIAIHSDLGNDADPTEYLHLMEEILRLYPDNDIVWMHMGFSKELTLMDTSEHIDIMERLLDAYPKLMLDVSWRVLWDNYFVDPLRRVQYVDFIDRYADRILPGSDFVASADKTYEIYQEELAVTSRILSEVGDEAFRNIALGQNYFRLLNLDYEAPTICSRKD